MAEKRLNTAFIGLGSNIGDREDYLQKSIHLLAKHQGIKVTKLSHIYETAPMGYIEQAAFLNMVVAIETQLTSHALYKHMLEVENELGRKRDIRWGPRTIDLDLLLFNSETIQTEDLEVPHPRMLERAFVMIPLLHVLGSELIPGIGSVVRIMEQLKGKDEVKLWEPPTCT